MLKDIASYYGFDDTVEISWGRAGANSSTENQELLTDYQAGVLPLREYLKKRWVDLSEEDVENWAQIIEKEQEKKSKQDTFGQFPFNEKDYFNEGDESVENESGNRQT
jgi:hypothetical protein